jgi:hypothetical protein
MIRRLTEVHHIEKISPWIYSTTSRPRSTTYLKEFPAPGTTTASSSSSCSNRLKLTDSIKNPQGTRGESKQGNTGRHVPGPLKTKSMPGLQASVLPPRFPAKKSKEARSLAELGRQDRAGGEGAGAKPLDRSNRPHPTVSLTKSGVQLAGGGRRGREYTKMAPARSKTPSRLLPPLSSLQVE